MKKIVIYIVLLLTPFSIVLGQLDLPSENYQQEAFSPRKFNEDSWAKMVNGTDFSEKFMEQNPRNPNTTREHNGDDSSDGFEQVQDQETSEPWYFPVGGGSIILKFFLILLAIIGLVFLLRALIGSELQTKNTKLNQRTSTSIDLANIEENLETTDPEQFIQQAISAGKYTLAVRLYYLSVLRTLAAQKIIKWKKDKTNLDYLRETKASSYYQTFREVTSIFERAWYGNRELDEQRFQQIAPKFQAIIQEIKSK